MLPAYVRGLTIELRKYSAEKKTFDAAKGCRAYFTSYVVAHDIDPNNPRKNGQKRNHSNYT